MHNFITGFSYVCSSHSTILPNRLYRRSFRAISAPSSSQIQPHTPPCTTIPNKDTDRVSIGILPPLPNSSSLAKPFDNYSHQRNQRWLRPSPSDKAQSIWSTWSFVPERNVCDWVTTSGGNSTCPTCSTTRSYQLRVDLRDHDDEHEQVKKGHWPSEGTTSASKLYLSITSSKVAAILNPILISRAWSV